MLLFNAFYSNAQEETHLTQRHWQNVSRFKSSTLPSLLYVGNCGSDVEKLPFPLTIRMKLGLSSAKKPERNG